jgi:hypothetical protein
MFSSSYPYPAVPEARKIGDENTISPIEKEIIFSILVIIFQYAPLHLLDSSDVIVKNSIPAVNDM